MWRKTPFNGSGPRWLAIAAFCLMLGIRLSAADLKYTVKRGDTLFSIARQYGTTVTTLAERNDLARSAHIYVGQTLLVPGKSNQPISEHSSLPPAIKKTIAAAHVTPGRWKYIVIHHSGVNTGTVQAMDRYHREVRHMENGLAYHFVIGNGHGMRDGEIAAGRRWREQLAGGHLASEAQNQIALGICLVGNFDQTKPTRAQMKSLKALVQSLLERCKLSPSAVKVHREINIVGTRCPGRYFPEREFKRELRDEAG